MGEKGTNVCSGVGLFLRTLRQTPGSGVKQNDLSQPYGAQRLVAVEQRPALGGLQGEKGAQANVFASIIPLSAQNPILYS